MKVNNGAKPEDIIVLVPTYKFGRKFMDRVHKNNNCRKIYLLSLV